MLVSFTVVPFQDGSIAKTKYGNFHKVQRIISDPNGLLKGIKQTLYFDSLNPMVKDQVVPIELDNYRLTFTEKIINGTAMKLAVLRLKQV